MKKLILLFLITSLGFSFNTLKEENISIHSHNHLHIQGNSHIHKHIHLDNGLSFFYEEQTLKAKKFTLVVEYLDIEKIYLNPIKQAIFKPPIL